MWLWNPIFIESHLGGQAKGRVKEWLPPPPILLERNCSVIERVLSGMSTADRCGLEACLKVVICVQDHWR